MMQQQPAPQMTKKEWKRQNSKKEQKDIKKRMKARHKDQLQQVYESTIGEKVEDYDDGKSVGKKEQARILRKRNEEQQARWRRLYKYMRAATFMLAVVWVGIVASWNIDAGLRLLAGLGSFFLFYGLGGFVIRGYLLWQKRPHNGRVYFVGPPLFVDPPLLAMVTLMVMHMVYHVANLFDGGQVPAAIAAGDQTMFQLTMQCVIPSIFALVTVSLLAVLVPNYAAQECWVFKESWKGEMVQYGVYVGYGLLAFAYSVCSWLYSVHQSGYFSAGAILPPRQLLRSLGPGSCRRCSDGAAWGFRLRPVETNQSQLKSQWIRLLHKTLPRLPSHCRGGLIE